ncbi:hypothetical protein HY621_03635 [Candidatus Uhrbacteria bacterium]|nr:hypothetical protein [Candidatus Uhrbacteria bacterium]
MRKKENGYIAIVYLPGVGSLVARSLHIYRQLFPQLAGLTGLLALAGFANLLLTGFLSSLVDGQRAFILFFVSIINLAIFIIFGFLYSYFFAAASHLIHEWYSQGRTLSIRQALELSRDRFSALYWVAIILSLMFYGSSFTGILPILFGVWYYFSVYIVLFEPEKGAASLAKSRYLLHGLFVKVFGRYSAIIAAYTVFFLILYNLLLGLPGGWVLALLLSFILLYFSFPFFIAYGYLQYHDTSAVERTTAFEFFKGEKVAIACWAALGLVIMVIGLFLSMLTEQARTRVVSTLSARAVKIMLPFLANSQSNVDKISDFLGTLKREKQAPIEAQPLPPTGY